MSQYVDMVNYLINTWKELNKVGEQPQFGNSIQNDKKSTQQSAENEVKEQSHKVNRQSREFHSLIDFSHFETEMIKRGVLKIYN